MKKEIDDLKKEIRELEKKNYETKKEIRDLKKEIREFEKKNCETNIEKREIGDLENILSNNRIFLANMLQIMNSKLTDLYQEENQLKEFYHELETVIKKIIFIIFNKTFIIFLVLKLIGL